MKFFCTKLLLPLSLILFHCDGNEPELEKTTIVTYQGNGDVIVETVFQTIPNLPIRIMTDAIMSPNYLYALNVRINGVSVDTSIFEFNYQKTEKGNFKYISLKNAHYKSTSDSIYIRYKTNILTPYQQSFEEGQYIFPISMAEIVPQSMPIVNVNSILITKSQTELYLPRISFFNNYKIIESDASGNPKYARSYLCTAFGELLFLLYPKFVFQLNNYKSIGQYDHWLNLKDLKLVEEGFHLNFKQIDSTKGIIFSLPFKKEIAHPDINLALGGNNISPFPIDSASFDSILHSEKEHPNEAFYYIGTTSNPYEIKTHYLLNIIFSMQNNEIGSLELRYKYNSKNILQKLDYFKYEIHVEPQYLPSIRALNKFEIFIPDNFSFLEDESYKGNSHSIGEHSLVFNNINKPEFLSSPLIVPILKDGLTYYKFIRVSNIIIFFISILFLIGTHYNIIKFNMKKLYTILFQILLFVANLFLVGFSKEEDIFELFMFVWGFLPLTLLIITLFYDYKIGRNKILVL